MEAIHVTGGMQLRAAFRFFFAAAFLSAMLFLSVASAEEKDRPAAPIPGLTWVFSARVDVSPAIEQGLINGGKTRFIPIIGGEVYGPRLSGVVLDGGGDWQIIRPGGLTDIEARYFIQADDGTVIGVHNVGVRVADEATIDKLAAGEFVSADQYYFRAQPRFTLTDGEHDWMKRHVFIARGTRFPDRVIIDFYLVE